MDEAARGIHVMVSFKEPDATEEVYHGSGLDRGYNRPR